MKIYHIVMPEDWAAAEGGREYSAASLRDEGFIHCSFEDQLDGVLTRYYSGAGEVVVLEIEPAALSAELVEEPSTNNEVYPHIYGALNLDAVTKVFKRAAPETYRMHKNFIEVIEAGSREEELLSQIDLARLPRHVAIIMDGNGRWAKLRGKPRVFGHKEGAESVRAILDTFGRLEIEAATLFAFSTENWKRPAEEVEALMQMLKYYIGEELENVHRNNIRFRAIGRIDGLADDVRAEIRRAEDRTAGNTGTLINVALNYGGRAEIVEAAKKACDVLIGEGRPVSELTEEDVEAHLYTHGLPELDLMIRTSGEMRVSNFLLWQVAYSEIYVTETLFPDFRREEIFKAIIEYQKRDRRFGGVGDSAEA
jgi:undecaprenyl diphosphate synthase